MSENAPQAEGRPEGEPRVQSEGGSFAPAGDQPRFRSRGRRSGRGRPRPEGGEFAPAGADAGAPVQAQPAPAPVPVTED